MQVHLNTEVSKVEAKDGKVTGVLSDGEKKLSGRCRTCGNRRDFL